MKLYEIIENMENILNSNEDGEFTEEQMSEIHYLELSLTEKSENIAKIIKNIDCENTAIDNEIKRLKEKKERNSKITDRLKKYMIDNFNQLEIKKLNTPLFDISVRNSDSVNITDISQVEKEYIRVKTTEEADKVSIKNAIKDGKDIKGAEIITNQSLIIK